MAEPLEEQYRPGGDRGRSAAGALPMDMVLSGLMRLAQRVPGEMEALCPNVVAALGAEE